MSPVPRIAVACIAVALGGWALVGFAWRPYQCNAEITALRVRTDAASETADEYARTVRARANLADLARLRETCPTSVRVPMLMGANAELLGRLEDAERSYREALLLERRPEIYIAIAQVATQQGHIDEAVENYVIATRFAPTIIEEILSPELNARVRARLKKR